MSIESLPPEILVIVCQSLHYQDIIRLSLASQTFSEVCQHPVLWKHFKLTIGSETMSKIKTILENKRFSCLEELSLVGCEMRDKEVRILLKSSVKRIKIGSDMDFDKDSSIQEVSPSLLGRLVNSRDGFYYQNWDESLTEHQLTEIFLQMRDGSQLRSLTINNNQMLERIPTTLYAASLNKLNTLALPCQDDISFKDFIQQMAISSNIKELDLSYNNLADVPPHTFSQALSKLEESIFLFQHKMTFVFHRNCVWPQLV